jgi:hypothetical protein
MAGKVVAKISQRLFMQAALVERMHSIIRVERLHRHGAAHDVSASIRGWVCGVSGLEIISYTNKLVTYKQYQFGMIIAHKQELPGFTLRHRTGSNCHGQVDLYAGCRVAVCSGGRLC